MKINNFKTFVISFLLLPIVLILIAAGSLIRLGEITNMNWQTFWMAAEALATAGTLFVALIVLVRELPKFRKEIAARKQEMAARKIEGLKYAVEQLNSQDFQNWYIHIIDSLKTDGDEFPEGIYASIVDALARIDIVAKLIELDYVDKDLLLSIYAFDFATINGAMTNFEHRKNSRIQDLRARFPKGFALLNEASIVLNKEAFERLDKDKAI